MRLFYGVSVNINDLGLAKFGSVTTVNNTFYDIVAAVLFGVVCGLLGSFFIYVQTKMIKFRKMNITTNSRKIIEGVFFAFVTAAGFYSAVLLTRETCLKASPSHFHGRVNE
jgi:hypothetical protein